MPKEVLLMNSAVCNTLITDMGEVIGLGRIKIPKMPKKYS
jgi:hypothetical protein